MKSIFDLEEELYITARNNQIKPSVRRGRLREIIETDRIEILLYFMQWMVSEDGEKWFDSQRNDLMAIDVINKFKETL